MKQLLFCQNVSHANGRGICIFRCNYNFKTEVSPVSWFSPCFLSIHWSTSFHGMSFPGMGWSRDIGSLYPFSGQNLNLFLIKQTHVNHTYTVEDLTGQYLIKSENRELRQSKICCKIPVRSSNQECDPISIISESDSFDQQCVISVQGLVDLKHVHSFRQMLHLKYSCLDCGTLTV